MFNLSQQFHITKAKLKLPNVLVSAYSIRIMDKNTKTQVQIEESASNQPTYKFDPSLFSCTAANTPTEKLNAVLYHTEGSSNIRHTTIYSITVRDNNPPR